MRAVIQRVTQAHVSVENEIVGNIGPGGVVLFAAHRDDTDEMIPKLASKIIKLRIFGDEMDKMNKSLLELGGKLLVVSQFTLYADTKKGNRPSFITSAGKEKAERFYELFIGYIRSKGIHVETGVFGAMMEVSLTNSGPVTIILDS